METSLLMTNPLFVNELSDIMLDNTAKNACFPVRGKPYTKRQDGAQAISRSMLNSLN